jgi:hypothetical protein
MAATDIFKYAAEYSQTPTRQLHDFSIFNERAPSMRAAVSVALLGYPL